MTNKVKKSAREKKLEQSLLDAIEALRFYGHPDNYFAIAFMFDPPCGDFRNDFSRVDKSFGYDRLMPGKLARRTLEKIAKRFPDEPKPEEPPSE